MTAFDASTVLSSISLNIFARPEYYSQISIQAIPNAPPAHCCWKCGPAELLYAPYRTRPHDLYAVLSCLLSGSDTSPASILHKVQYTHRYLFSLFTFTDLYTTVQITTTAKTWSTDHAEGLSLSGAFFGRKTEIYQFQDFKIFELSNKSQSWSNRTVNHCFRRPL